MTELVHRFPREHIHVIDLPYRLWFDPSGLNGHPCGQIEPMRVQGSYRGAGLDKALLVETVRRLHAMGSQHLVVDTHFYRADSVGLYDRIGFRLVEKLPIYARDYV